MARVEHQLALHRQRNTIAAIHARVDHLQHPVGQLVARVEALAAQSSAEQIAAIDAIARTIQSGIAEIARLTE